VIRVAAVADLHYGHEPTRTSFDGLKGKADILFICGDLTHHGSVDEARALARDLEDLPLPVVVVFGNHDFHQNRQKEIETILADAGVTVLEGASAVFTIRGSRVGIAGLKGFGGGYFGACVTEFGEQETKDFARHGRNQAQLLGSVLSQLDTDFRFVLTHFSPVEGTLEGEPREIYPFLGSYLLAEAIDNAGADAAFHGHAHRGVEKGVTRSGIPVRNVARSVIRHSYHIYTFDRTFADRVRFAEASVSPPGRILGP